MNYPMLIDKETQQALAQLVARAEANPVPIERMMTLSRDFSDPLKAAHMNQMTEQTVYIPTCYCVTYSVEEQPFGQCRHMSLSITTPGARMPHPVAVWEVARLLGFWGDSIEAVDHAYPETLTQGEAINLIQRFAPAPGDLH
jgi:hypothetical protein